MYICIYVYMYICIYVYMYICIYVYVYMYIYIINKKYLKTKLYMHNTIGDIALTNISREKNTSMILCSVQNKSYSHFLSLGYVLCMLFLKFG